MSVDVYLIYSLVVYFKVVKFHVFTVRKGTRCIGFTQSTDLLTQTFDVGIWPTEAWQSIPYLAFKLL